MGHRNFRCPPELPLLLIFLFFAYFDLDLISSSSLSYSKCSFEFFWLSWAELEQMCLISKANSIWIKLLTHKSLLIVQSQTKHLPSFCSFADLNSSSMKQCCSTHFQGRTPARQGDRMAPRSILKATRLPWEKDMVWVQEDLFVTLTIKYLCFQIGYTIMLWTYALWVLL